MSEIADNSKCCRCGIITCITIISIGFTSMALLFSNSIANFVLNEIMKTIPSNVTISAHPTYLPTSFQIDPSTTSKIDATTTSNIGLAAASKVDQELEIKYYYYEGEIFQYFAECIPNTWSKQSAEHFLIKQLKQNKNKNRVYNCSEADIFVLPVTLGCVARHDCNHNKTSMSSHVIIDKLNKAIFNDPLSCWNTNIKSRNTHFMIVGDFKGRQIIQRKWIENKFMFADACSNGLNRKYRKKRNICSVPSGFVSLLSDPGNIKKMKDIDIGIVSFEDDYNATAVRSINVVRDVNNWKNRKYNLFFMGQADERNNKYKLRRIALKHLNTSNENVLIETPGHQDPSNYMHCNTNNLSFPCSTKKSAMLYIKLLSQSKFNLMFRGDDACSPRFYDAISLDVINIVISDNFRYCLIGYNQIDLSERNKMFLWIKETDFISSPYKAVYDVINQYNDSYFEYMLHTTNKWKKYLLWDTINSETAEFVLKSALHCYRK